MPSSQKSSNDLNTQRRRAVQMRLSGNTLADVSKEVGLSAPTIIAAVKAFKAGGWTAVDVKPRGRPRLNDAHNSSTAQALAALLAHLATNPGELWSSTGLRAWLKQHQQLSVSLQTAASYLQSWQLQPENQYRRMEASKAAAVQTWLDGEYRDFKTQAKNQGATLLWIGVRTTQTGLTQLHAHTLRGRCVWMPFNKNPDRHDYTRFLSCLLNEFPKGIAVVVPNKTIGTEAQHFSVNANAPVLCAIAAKTNSEPNNKPESISTSNSTTLTAMTKTHSGTTLTHLQMLEAQSIQIMREVIAEADNPVMLYSAGKDSSVMLHLARKAFYPAAVPMPLLHIDTTWKFQETIAFRDNVVDEFGLELITHTNAEGVGKGVNPFTHGSVLHIDIMKTEALKQALDKHDFDVAISGTRRDEELPRAKERVFSSRTADHGWQPNHQQPEIWNLYNTQKNNKERMRVFPLSNWSELDIWYYIHQQAISIVPLYFAAERPVVERDGSLILVDDDRLPLNRGEVPMMRSVRFRTLDCYPLTNATESTAATVPEIIQEILQTTTSEQQARMTDHDSAALLEKRKQEGYF